ncbi:MAG: GNAT family N-acetyltransferase [Chloroflexi bacterium]|uniref:GNAT family N-acetyltransferase n=1 Tax=Candidatus Chlorohelix allophototropha TaxID=3003348 RepID=A0A8T7LZD6_9CHLR|nr:GNAT family N-acetyltransferase [Chloroflexota bacterium]WJW66790.1 GNAT family N-acetyltransferase [Chloroflexota bacterium L227-S17]
MRTVNLHSKEEIEHFLRKDQALRVYELGDLDDFFWEDTEWYGLKEDGVLQQVLLLYCGSDLPVLIGQANGNAAHLSELLEATRPRLPSRFYSHLSPEVIPALQEDYQVEYHGAHYKMALQDCSRLEKYDKTHPVQLSWQNVEEIEQLYIESYPQNWFDPRMLDTGFYYGIRNNNKLVSIGGVHVYSPQYKVAAVGNVATHPSYRGRGYSLGLCAHICRELLKTVDTIGLNVRSDNPGALAAYRKLGFEIAGEYAEYTLELK